MILSLVSREAEQPSQACFLHSPMPPSAPSVPGHHLLFEPRKDSERQMMSEWLEGTKVVRGKCASGITLSLSCPWHLQPGCLPVNMGLQELQFHIAPAASCTGNLLLVHWFVRQLGWVESSNVLLFVYHSPGRLRLSYCQSVLQGTEVGRHLLPATTELRSRDLCLVCS